MPRVAHDPAARLFDRLADVYRRLRALETRPASAALTHTAWTTYVPTLTGSTSNPDVGSGSALGWYSQVADTVYFKAQFVFGATGVVRGSGNYLVGLPVAAGSFGTIQPGAGYVRDVSAGNTGWRVVALELDSSAAVRMLLDAESSGPFVNSGGPWGAGPASGDRIYVAGFYGVP